MFVHGLFGEVVDDDKEQETVNIKSMDYEKVQTEKGANILNVWFEFFIAVVCIVFCADLVKLPREETLVILKVRMDN